MTSKRQPSGIADWLQRRRARRDATKVDAFIGALSEFEEHATSICRRWEGDGLTIRNEAASARTAVASAMWGVAEASRAEPKSADRRSSGSRPTRGGRGA